MLTIDCPYCGPRDDLEFACGGESHVVRPGPPDAVSDAQWADYLFNRRNPRGMTLERWQHLDGCGQWFNVARDTLTHEIVSTYQMSEPAPVLS